MRRHDRIVRQNDRLAAGARIHHFGDAPVPFLCECEDEGCQEFVSLTLRGYERRRAQGLLVLAPAHRVDSPAGACEDPGAGWAEAATDR